MNENEKKTGDWKMIIGGIALIIVLFLAIKLIFAGLEKAVPPERLNPDAFAASQSQSLEEAESGEEAPSFCVHCGKALPDSFQWGQFCPYCGKKVE